MGTIRSRKNGHPAAWKHRGTCSVFGPNVNGLVIRRCQESRFCGGSIILGFQSPLFGKLFFRALLDIPRGFPFEFLATSLFERIDVGRLPCLCVLQLAEEIGALESSGDSGETAQKRE